MKNACSRFIATLLKLRNTCLWIIVMLKVVRNYLTDIKSFSLEEYNRVFGDVSRQRVSGRIVKAIRAKAALLAASPAYSEGTTTTWEDAANYAAEVIDLHGGISELDPKGGFVLQGQQCRCNKSFTMDETRLKCCGGGV